MLLIVPETFHLKLNLKRVLLILNRWFVSIKIISLGIFFKELLVWGRLYKSDRYLPTHFNALYKSHFTASPF